MKYLFFLITISGIACVFFSECLPDKISSDFFIVKDKSTKNTITLVEFNQAYRIWHEKNILNYSMKIRYSAFSPMSGIWDIIINNGQVINWKYMKTENDEKYREFATKLTMEHLFEMAQAAINTKDNNKFHIYTQFDTSDGHVLYILKKSRGNGKYVPTDTNFRYDVLGLDTTVAFNN